MKSENKNFWNVYQVESILIIWSGCIVLRELLGKNTVFIGDAVDYWERGKAIWSTGRFSLFSIPDGFRGYVYPLYLGLCYKLGNGTKVGFYIINSLIIALLFSVIFPQMNGGRRIKDRADAIRSIISFVIFSCFFYGLEIYVLSDLAAIVLCFIAILIKKNMVKETRIFPLMGASVLFGIFIYLSYNVRTIYMFAGITLVIMSILEKNGKMVYKLYSLCATTVGVLLAGLPQLYMNLHNIGAKSISVPTNGLMLTQLFWGIQYQRYDTYVGGTQQNIPQIYFVDKVGMNLIERFGIQEFASWGQYLKFLGHHLFEVAGIYVRHIVNMLFPCWPNQYVMDLDNNKIFIAFMAYSCFFILALGVFFNKTKKSSVWKNYIPVMVPVLFIIPGAVEVRFFVAFYMMMIGFLCYNLDWKNLLEEVVHNKLQIGILYFGMGLIMISLWTSMLASETEYQIFMY